MSHSDPAVTTVPDEDAVLLTIDEASALLAVSRSTVKRLLAAGEVPAFRVGAAVRVPTYGIEAYLSRRAVAAHTDEGVVP
jgi:excisionase family DNA binding protein